MKRIGVIILGNLLATLLCPAGMAFAEALPSPETLMCMAEHASSSASLEAPCMNHASDQQNHCLEQAQDTNTLPQQNGDAPLLPAAEPESAPFPPFIIADCLRAPSAADSLFHLTTVILKE